MRVMVEFIIFVLLVLLFWETVVYFLALKSTIFVCQVSVRLGLGRLDWVDG